jgi:nitrite reductase/ring-hydroxylating ferredoxin subunit
MSPSHDRLSARRGARGGWRARPGWPGWPRPGPRLLSAPAGLARRLEHAEALDRVARPLAGAVTRGMGAGGQADALHGVWLGQPVHPALTALPLGFWTSAAVLDFVPGSQRASQVLLALGLAGALPAAAAGLADWSALHREQQRVGLAHAASGAGASALFAASLFARAAGRVTSGRLLTLGGLAAVTAGSFLGRHMAFGLGAGASHAEPVAHLAPLGWHDLCRIYDLPDGRLARRQLGYLTLAVLRQGSEVMAIADQCAHLGGPLHQGILTEGQDGPCVRCPWHGSTFSLTNGTVLHGPATARQPAFDSRIVEGGMVQVRPARPAPPARHAR